MAKSHLTKSEKRERKAKIISSIFLFLGIAVVVYLIVTKTEPAPDIEDFPEIIENIVEKDVKSKDANVKNFNITGVEFSGDYADSGTVYGIVDYAETENSDIVIQYPAKLTYTDCDSTIRLKGDALNPLIDYDSVNNIKRAVESGTLGNIEIIKNNYVLDVLGHYPNKIGSSKWSKPESFTANCYGLFCGAPYLEENNVCFELTYFSCVSRKTYKEGNSNGNYAYANAGGVLRKRIYKFENTFEDINDVFYKFKLLLEENTHNAIWGIDVGVEYENINCDDSVNLATYQTNAYICEEELNKETYRANI